jgi:hypothetical protein
MSSGTTVKQYPGLVDTFATWENDVDTIAAVIVNDIQDQVRAIETELGTDPAGSMTDVKTRLAVCINSNGTLKVDNTSIGLNGSNQLYSKGLFSGIQKKTITVVTLAGTFAFDFTDQGLVDPTDAVYQVCLTTVGTNATKCWAVLSGAKATTGFTIALMTAGTNGSVPYNASTGDGGLNVDVDVLIIHA